MCVESGIAEGQLFAETLCRVDATAAVPKSKIQERSPLGQGWGLTLWVDCLLMVRTEASENSFKLGFQPVTTVGSQDTLKY